MGAKMNSTGQDAQEYWLVQVCRCWLSAHQMNEMGSS